MDLDDENRKLSDYLLELEIKYIENHKNPLEQPDEYNLDVRSYCVLCHAAFEEYIETLCIYTLNEIVVNFERNSRFSYSTLCLLHFCQSITLDDDKWSDEQMSYDYIRKILNEEKSTMSKQIFQNNHGIGLKYLKKLLIPLGLDLPHDIKHIGSLNQLTKLRGGFAHTSFRACSTISPDDARICVEDVYEMCMKLTDDVKKIAYYKK